MNHKLGHDEHRQREQKPSVRLDVVQEWDPDRAANGVRFENRQQQERQPRD
ncbi:MAG: hypothetical protein WBV41_17360 [Terriglobales bacterium]